MELPGSSSSRPPTVQPLRSIPKELEPPQHTTTINHHQPPWSPFVVGISPGSTPTPSKTAKLDLLADLQQFPCRGYCFAADSGIPLGQAMRSAAWSRDNANLSVLASHINNDEPFQIISDPILYSLLEGSYGVYHGITPLLG